MNKNKSGFISMTLVYTFLIIFLFIMLAILRTYNEKDKFLETINEQINEDISANVKTKITIINRILEDNSPINENDVSLRFFDVANSHFGNGNGLYYTEKLDRIDENSDGASNRMYYFRGTTERNHIVFAGYCWRILRTNEDGSLRIRFNGPYSQSKGCLTTNGAENNTDITIGKTMFHINHSDFSNEDYVKYQVDKSGSMINSEVKQLLEEWYHENLVVEEHEGSGDYYSSKVADEFYCNDTYSFIDKDNNVVSGKYAAHSLVPMFKDPSNKNIYGYSNIVSTLTFKCNLLKDSANENERISTLEDAYDVSSQGNHKLIYPIGLLTAQDVVLAGGYLSNELDEYKGGKNGMDNESYYLYTGFNYWTMSPYSNLDNDPKMVYVNSRGRLSSASVKESSSNYYVIPVISLKSTVEIASGRGTAKSPYIVK